MPLHLEVGPDPVVAVIDDFRQADPDDVVPVVHIQQLVFLIIGWFHNQAAVDDALVQLGQEQPLDDGARFTVTIDHAQIDLLGCIAETFDTQRGGAGFGLLFPAHHADFSVGVMT